MKSNDKMLKLQQYLCLSFVLHPVHRTWYNRAPSLIKTKPQTKYDKSIRSDEESILFLNKKKKERWQKVGSVAIIYSIFHAFKQLNCIHTNNGIFIFKSQKYAKNRKTLHLTENYFKIKYKRNFLKMSNEIVKSAEH